MPRRRWRSEVLEELQGMRLELRDGFALNRSEFEQNREAIVDVRRVIGEVRSDMQRSRDATRDMKGSVDRNTDAVDRWAETVAGYSAQVSASQAVIEGLAQDIRAQTSALLVLIDEIRRNGTTR